MFKNSLRNRRRSILTICSIALSLCLLGVLLALYYAFFISTETTPAQARRLVTRNKVSLALIMPMSYQQKIERVPGIAPEAVMAYQWFGGVYKDPKNFFARFATDPARLFNVFPEWKISEEQKKAFQSERTACVIGRAIATKYNLNLGDRVTLKGDIFPVTLELTVRGIFDDEFNKETLWFHMQYLFESLGPGRRDFAGTFATLAQTPEDAPRVAQAIDDMFRNAPVQTKTESEREYLRGFLSLLGNVKLILLSICGAVTFTILLVSGNTMAMSVRERIREVGILKTLGFQSSTILGLIVGESAVLALIGGVIGCVLASGLCAVIRQAPAVGAGMQTLALQPPVAALCLLIALAIGVISSFVPAYNAARTGILDSLRYTG